MIANDLAICISLFKKDASDFCYWFRHHSMQLFLPSASTTAFALCSLRGDIFTSLKNSNAYSIVPSWGVVSYFTGRSDGSDRGKAGTSKFILWSRVLSSSVNSALRLSKYSLRCGLWLFLAWVSWCSIIDKVRTFCSRALIIVWTL